MSVHHDTDIHIQIVNIRPLFAIDFDSDVMFIQVIGDFLVLKALSCHLVAPVACSVADRKENRLLLLHSPFECLISPRIPIDRLMGMLQQIGRICFNEPVMFLRGSCMPWLVVQLQTLPLRLLPVSLKRPYRSWPVMLNMPKKTEKTPINWTSCLL